MHQKVEPPPPQKKNILFYIQQLYYSKGLVKFEKIQKSEKNLDWPPEPYPFSFIIFWKHVQEQKIIIEKTHKICQKESELEFDPLTHFEFLSDFVLFFR